jgi:primosomal protein N' (replication factor Y)
MIPIIKIIDLKKIRKERKQFQAISTDAIIEIQNALKQRKKIVIFINRKGLATSIVCQECGFVFKCPNCDIPLGFHNEGKLICHHCNYKIFLPSSCPSCKGYKLKSLGVGMDRIAEEIKKSIIPSPTFALIEGEMPDEQELDIFKKFNNGDIKILIGTEAILRPQLEYADLVIVASIDPALFLPDYNSEERVFLNLSKLKGLSREKLIIQTLIPQNKLFEYLIKNQEKKFLEEEKKWRKDYLWPPYIQLIKLTLTNKDKRRGEKEAEETKKILEEAINKLMPENSQKCFILLGPSQAFIFKEKGFYKWNILVKYRYFESKVKEEINPLSGLNLLSPVLTKKELILRNKILKCVPINWKIDVDPINTL